MSSKLFAYLPFVVLVAAALIAAFHIKLYW
jgi:hypothetical protein